MTKTYFNNCFVSYRNIFGQLNVLSEANQSDSYSIFANEAFVEFNKKRNFKISQQLDG